MINDPLTNHKQKLIIYSHLININFYKFLKIIFHRLEKLSLNFPKMKIFSFSNIIKGKTFSTTKIDEVKVKIEFFTEIMKNKKNGFIFNGNKIYFSLTV